MSTHACPGGCGRDIAPNHFACRVCSDRLPFELARAIRIHYRRDPHLYARAIADARHWLQTHRGVKT